MEGRVNRVPLSLRPGWSRTGMGRVGLGKGLDGDEVIGLLKPERTGLLNVTAVAFCRLKCGCCSSAHRRTWSRSHGHVYLICRSLTVTEA